jgi:predicted ATP-grasp superfamily ATP-dependent carboligase
VLRAASARALTVPDTSVPAVVLNAFTHCGVGIVRSLGRLGVPVYCVHGDPRAPSLRSRYCRRICRWDIQRHPPATSVEYLVEVARRVGGAPLLIPTEDVSCLFVDDHADELGTVYRLPRRPRGLARALSSKREMFLLCRKHGVPTPAASFPVSREDVDELGGSVAFPVMVKGVDNREFLDAPGAGKRIARTASELVSTYERLTRGTENRALLVQEYIPGDATSVWMFNGYFNRESDCLFGLTGRKLRQYPPYIGQTSLGLCVENDDVRRTTEGFMKAVGYTGILDIGFRYDPRDDRYKLLDVNPRVGAAFRLFLGRNGMDVVRALYLDMTDQAVPATEAPVHRKWLVENYDLAASVTYYRDGELRPRDWLTSLRGVEEAAWFSWDDPVPFGAMWIYSAKYALNRMVLNGRRRRSGERRTTRPGIGG